jgi:regulatory protein
VVVIRRIATYRKGFFKICAIKMTDQISEIRNQALAYLTRREHSRSELAQKLYKKGFPEEIVDEVLQELLVAGVQSDARFCETFIYARRNHGYGPIKIKLELQEHGVAAETLEEKLQCRDALWDELASKVRVKKFGSSIPEEFAEKAKQMKFLQYKGFTSEQINKIWSR